MTKFHPKRAPLKMNGEVSGTSAALWRHRLLLARGYHKLFTVSVVLAIAVGIFVKGIHFLWTAPARDETEPDEATLAASYRQHRPSEWYREIRARTDINRKFGVYNQRLSTMADRGEISRTTADDARRGAGIFDPANDTWRGQSLRSEHKSAASAFNPAVTLTGM